MSNYFAYMRISTKEERAKQRFTRQENAIERYAKENKVNFILEEKDDASGKSFDGRNGWKKIENLVHSGDTIVFKDISRFTREAENGYKKYMELMSAGVNLVFIDNPTISTDYIKDLLNVAEQQENNIVKETLDFIVRLLLKVELERVERERLIISQRTKDGLAASNKKSGRAIGALDKLTPELRQDIIGYIKQHETGEIVTQNSIMKKYNISRNTLKKYANILRKELIKK